MKVQDFFTTFATLAAAVSGSALPHARRQNGTNGIAPIQFVTTTVTAPNGATQTLVVPINISINGGVAPGSVPGSGAGVAPGSGAAPGSVAAPAPAAGGVSPVGSNTGLVTGVIQNGVCVCNGATIVAQGLYVGTVQTQIIIGTSTFVTASPVTTSGAVTVVNGQVLPATPVVTQTYFPVTNTNLPLPAGQQYQQVVLPGSITITIIVTIGPVAIGGNTGNNGISPVVTGLLPNGTAFTSTVAPIAGSPSTSPVVTAAPTTSAAALASPIVFTSAPSSTGVSGAQPTSPPSGAPIGTYGQSPLVNQANFINDMLVQHNAYRARNGAPPMTWDPVLANYALANAQQNAATRNLLHTFQQTPGTTPYAGSQTYGENIGFQSGANNPLKIVWLFYNEESQYNRATPGFQTNAGHFTQLVWVGSTRLGCAYVATNDASQTAYYLACEYAPAGNINSPAEFTANVLPNDGSSFPTAPADNI